MRLSRVHVGVVLLLVIFLNVGYLLFVNYEYIEPIITGPKSKSAPKAGHTGNGTESEYGETANDSLLRDAFAVTYNRGEWPSEYEKGMERIKKRVNRLSKIAPGIEPYSEDSFDRDINDDVELREMGDLPATSSILGLYLQVSDEEVATLRRTHKLIMQMLPETVPENTFGGRGIVMTGGGKYFPMVLTAIRWIRDMDNDIPIEVFMKDKSEYESHICEGLFSTLNVECRVIREIYGEKLSDKLDSGYSLKPLSILASKFDHIYFMDVDSYPLTSVDKMFQSKVYKQSGYLLNSDYWPRFISPRFYEIVGIELGGRARGKDSDQVLFQSDRKNAIPGQSTESGQIFVHKSAHIKSLMLSTYYNIYGPNLYFTLLTQRGPGEGDKDTYAAAAKLCGEPYYQTQKGPLTLGFESDGSFHGTTMVQPNFESDYEHFEGNKKKNDVKMFALHANYVKANPKYMFVEDEVSFRVPKLKQQRFFGTQAEVDKRLKMGEDTEHRLFKTMTDFTCDWAAEQGYVPGDWKDEDVSRLCRLMKAHTEWLKENHNVTVAADSPYWYDLDKQGLA